VDLQSAVSDLNPSWKVLLSDALETPSFKQLQNFLQTNRTTIYPSVDKVFNAYNLCNPKDIKVVILGQDPYHDVNQAHGLAFSVDKVSKLPPSLKNIFQELSDDLSLPPRKSGNLTSWAEQGVFLLNTVLTVTAHKANSHKGEGWEAFTDATIKILSDSFEHIVFILWGGSAAKKIKLIDQSKHLIIKSAHPSPLSVYRGFWKSKPFSQANHYLKEHKREAIDWNR
jgi:uracil-DNA glycosylase